MTDRTADALATSVMTIDAARRVGWAKAFDESEKNDELSRENNMLREERDAYRRGFSFLFGILTEHSDGRPVPVKAALAAETAGYDLVVDDAPRLAGRRHAAAIAALDEDVEARKMAKSERQKSASRSARQYSVWHKEGRKRERDLIRRRFGFSSAQEMFAVLAGWQKAAGRPTLMSNRAAARFDERVRPPRNLRRELRNLAHLVDQDFSDPEEDDR